MASRKQTEANRRNAKRSTGPKTPEGKTASARLRARETVLSAGNQAAFLELLAALESELAPSGAHEHNMVLQIASAEWRLLRHARME